MIFFLSSYIYIPLIIILFIVVLFFILLLICFLKTFYSPSRTKTNKLEYPVLNESVYKPYHSLMIDYIKKANKLEYKDASIKSFDGLTLKGKFYKYSDNAVIEIIFHGYKGSAKRDLSGGIDRCFKLGHSVLIVDNRASGFSDGHVISFGINESKDCLRWIDYVINNIDKNAKIILAGISMGAATVMMVSNKELPQNVIGIVADCGYTSPKEIIKIVIKNMHLPVKLFYPLIKLSAKIFGRFNLEENCPIQALKNAKVPVFFIHGDEDAFIPFSMSKESYDACCTNKKIVKIAKAGHGLAYAVDPITYLKEMDDFFAPYVNEKA